MSPATSLTRNQKLAALAFVLGVALVYYASHPLLLCRQLIIRDDEALYARLHLGNDLPYAWLTESDYSFRLAEALLQGKLGLTEPPPEWVNETIPLRGRYYSVFPLGSVLTMLPFALAHRLIAFSPSGAAIALIGALATFLFLRFALRCGRNFRDAVWLTLFSTLGTWLWTNTAMGGAWQLALGFAMTGELAAILCTSAAPRPFLAGLFFAFAFGNRTEVILTAPIFIYRLLRDSESSRQLRARMVMRFCALPLVLGVATLFYNYARFGSPFDFGLARLPGVLAEPWYGHGIFSVRAIPANAWQMLLEPWRRVAHSPWLLPDGFGGSIFFNAPFLFCIFLPRPSRNLAAWIAIALLTSVFWCHGNTGGWQFSYRGAIVMLPWFFLLLLEYTPLRRWQIALICFSIGINTCATFFFLWTNWIQP